jgi:hypothetical protein
MTRYSSTVKRASFALPVEAGAKRREMGAGTRERCRSQAGCPSIISDRFGSARTGTRKPVLNASFFDFQAPVHGSTFDSRLGSVCPSGH